MFRALLVELFVLACVAGGCYPTWAPPVRALEYGAPGRLEEGRLEVSLQAGGIIIPDTLNVHAGVGLTDWFALEAGANVQTAFKMGFGGVRFSLVPNREHWHHFVGDLELGVGGGRGGQYQSCRANQPPNDTSYGPCDGVNDNDRHAYGEYQGIGLGYKVKWFTFYTRTRLEVAWAGQIPITYWPSFTVGFEFDLKRAFAFSLSGGYIGYRNSFDREDGWFYQLGITAFIDAWGAARERHRAR